MLRFIAIALLTACAACGRCWAWGEDGHRVIALVADHYLTPATRQRIATTLAFDGGLAPAVPRDIASAGPWADRYRDSDRNGAALRYRQTSRWHYVNLDLRTPDLRKACYGRPPLQPDQLAARGPARACIVDKIRQFRAEWLAPDTDPAERQLALLFLLHLVADLHQPLHVSDDGDQGGNRVDLAAPGFKTGSLHRFWDTAIVRRLDSSPTRLAARLVDGIDARQATEWRRGDVVAWAMETHAVAVDAVYAPLPAPQRDTGRRDVLRVGADYVDAAAEATALQLRRAGVRLARMLEPGGV